MTTEENPYKLATLAHALWTACRNAPTIEPRAPRSSPAPRTRIESVRATGRGESHPQKTSRRRAVLDWIVAQPDGVATIAALEAAFPGEPVRGHVQKLIDKNHLEPQ